MRLVVALTLAALLLPSIASAGVQEEPRDALAVTIVLLDDARAQISWSPAPNALEYDIYRGPTEDALKRIGSTKSLSFVDERIPEDEVQLVYMILTAAPLSQLADDVQQMRGKCVATRGLTGYSVTVAHCMPRAL